MSSQLETRVQSNIMVPMRDGVRLATDVYLPVTNAERETSQTAWPAIVIRTPYDKLGERMVEVGHFFASHGYAVVIQDVRGRYGSEGVFEPFVNETRDGHDCMVWVGGQPWCNRRVGTVGTSYLAQTQSSMATTRPPFLASQYVSQGYGNYHRTRSRRGGAFENHRINWILRMAATSPEAARDPVLREGIEQMRAQLADWISDGYPLRRGLTPLAALPSYEKALFDYMTRGAIDDFWQNPSLNLVPYYDRYKDVPVTWLGSWYDGYTLETPQNYLEVARRVSSPQRLVMGPWIHGMDSERLTYAGDVDFGPDAVFDSLGERLRWFDRTLKGEENGALDGAPVRIFVMGGGTGHRLASGKLDHGGSWRDEREWPLARTRFLPYYLHADGGLGQQTPGAAVPPTTYDFDPHNPVPTAAAPGLTVFDTGGGGFNQVQDPTSGAGNSALPHSARRDVVVFQTPPLEEDLELTGPVDVVLFVSSSAVDTDFTVKLIDQYPPSADYPQGYALELTHTIQRCRYRNGYHVEELMTPGTVYRLRFPLPPTSNRLPAGHRVRVDVSSSNWPKYEVNPNTGEPVGQHRRMLVATNSIYHDADHPSHLVLPVIP